MSELIWVGNTLYPRWFVIAVPLALVLTPFLLVLVWRAGRWWITYRRIMRRYRNAKRVNLGSFRHAGDSNEP